MARLLLDENMPRMFGTWMAGHTFQTTQRGGWAGLKNGDLLRAANGTFDIPVNLDRNLPFQQSVAHLDIAVLVIGAGSSKLEDLRPLVPEVLAAITGCVPGTVTKVPPEDDA